MDRTSGASRNSNQSSEADAGDDLADNNLSVPDKVKARHKKKGLIGVTLAGDSYNSGKSSPPPSPQLVERKDVTKGRKLSFLKPSNKTKKAELDSEISRLKELGLSQQFKEDAPLPLAKLQMPRLTTFTQSALRRPGDPKKKISISFAESGNVVTYDMDTPSVTPVMMNHFLLAEMEEQAAKRLKPVRINASHSRRARGISEDLIKPMGTYWDEELQKEMPYVSPRAVLRAAARARRSNPEPPSIVSPRDDQEVPPVIGLDELAMKRGTGLPEAPLSPAPGPARRLHAVSTSESSSSSYSGKDDDSDDGDDSSDGETPRTRSPRREKTAAKNVADDTNNSSSANNTTNSNNAAAESSSGNAAKDSNEKRSSKEARSSKSSKAEKKQRDSSSALAMPAAKDDSFRQQSALPVRPDSGILSAEQKSEKSLLNNVLSGTSVDKSKQRSNTLPNIPTTILPATPAERLSEQEERSSRRSKRRSRDVEKRKSAEKRTSRSEKRDSSEKPLAEKKKKRRSKALSQALTQAERDKAAEQLKAGQADAERPLSKLGQVTANAEAVDDE